MAATQEVPLPETVEQLLHAICTEKSQPPASVCARTHLWKAGEQEALRILSIIRNTPDVKTLNGFIIFLATKSPRSSLSPRSPLAVSPPPHHAQSHYDLGTPLGENKRKRDSDCNGDVITARRVLFGALPVEKNGVSKKDIVLDALERLEFRKAFLVFNYIGRSKLEDAVSVEKILNYERLEMKEFESQLWNDFGRENCQEKDRIRIMNWDAGERYYYHCHIDPEGNCRFKGPFLNKAATLLQKTLGDENVLIVKFLEQENEIKDTDAKLHCPAINKVAEEGIFFGRKNYKFFVFKDGGKEEKKKDPTSSPVKCYFVCMEGFANLLGKSSHSLKNMPVQEARALFMHIHKATSVSNYMSRFSLILSKTITLVLNYNDLHVEVLEDEPCLDENGEIVYDKDNKAMILTDGTGFISEDLALRCPHNCYNGYICHEENAQEYLQPLEASRFAHSFSKLSELNPLPAAPPLLIQFRMFYKGKAIKGTVLVNRKLPPNTIQVRRSMLKIDTDANLLGAPTVNSFEVVATSNKPKVAGLSKNLIALLHYGGVPKNVFLALLMEAVSKPLAVLFKPKAAVKAAVNWDFTDEYVPARMIASGIPLDEPFLQHRLSEIAKTEMKSLKGGKLPVDGSFYLMGTADPTHTLCAGEVCVILDQGPLVGPVLVYRNPGLHPGDVHVVIAKPIKGLSDYIGNSKYGIFFPSKGSRSMADEIAGGDYDGDMYWVSTNTELLNYFKPSEPWICCSPPNAAKHTSLPSAVALERDLFRLYSYTRFRPSSAMGIAADCWLAYMDRLLTLGDDCADEKNVLRKKIDELIDIYYDALDAPKKGKKVEVPARLMPENFPHHMGRGENSTYKSTSILGEIHDIVDQLSAPVTFWKLKCFEVEIPQQYLEKWRTCYNNYRADMKNALGESRNTAAVYQKYQKELYGGVDSLDLSGKPWKEIQLEALAIYHICYDFAERIGDPRKCGFAWRVAGDALFKTVLQSNGEKPILFAPSVISQMMR